MKVALEMHVAVLATVGSQPENEANNTRKPSQKKESKLLIPFGPLDPAIPEARYLFGLLNCSS